MTAMMVLTNSTDFHIHSSNTTLSTFLAKPHRRLSSRNAIRYCIVFSCLVMFKFENWEKQILNSLKNLTTVSVFHVQFAISKSQFVIACSPYNQFPLYYPFPKLKTFPPKFFTNFFLSEYKILLKISFFILYLLVCFAYVFVLETTYWQTTGVIQSKRIHSQLIL